MPITAKTGAIAAPQEGPASIEGRTDAERRSRQIGILLMCGTFVCFTLLDASAKWLGQSLPPLEVAFARYLGASLIVLGMVNPFRAHAVLRTQHFWLQTVRSCALFASTLLNFFALQHLQLAQTVSIFFALPLLVTLLAGPMLGEWVGPRRLIAIGVGFIGVLVVTRPGLGGFQNAMLLSLVGTFCNAFYNIWTRKLATTDSWRTTLTYSSLLGALVLTALLPSFWVWPQTSLQWLVMLVPGLAGAIGHYLLILAHRRAPAAVLAPFIYTEMIWMVGVGYLLFGDVPTLWTLLGGAIVISSGLYLWYRERVVRSRAPPPIALL